MKFKAKSILMILAIVFCITGFSSPVSANTKTSTGAESKTETTSESQKALTPRGNLTTVDDVHQVTDTADKDTVEEKQFITVQSKNGNTFYIVIDRSGTTENAYLLNAVDENDLLALTEENNKAAAPAKCTCTTKCEVGNVKADCAVCAKNKDECIGTAAAATEAPKTEETPAKKKNSIIPLIGLIAFAVLGAGGALYWNKIKNKKSSTKGSTDPNGLFEEDDEDYEIEDEETEIETYPETEDDDVNNEESEDIDK